MTARLQTSSSLRAGCLHVQNTGAMVLKSFGPSPSWFGLQGGSMRLKLCPCGAVTDARSKVCTTCGRGKKRATQGTTKAGYGWDWQQLRQRFIAENPLCSECAKSGVATSADEVHHIVPIAESPWLRLEWNNLVALCVPCHRAMDHERRTRGAG
jgi:5-methylcytosine-specific restriction protein A